MTSGMIPQYFIDDLLQRIDLSQVIGSRVQLKKAGTNYKGCCPFHEEKTPSFHVTPSKGFYHCFGCGVHGDAISFLREMDGLSFSDAIEELAKIAGLTVPRDEQQQRKFQKQQTQLSALEDACAFYQEQLRSHSDKERVLTYLKSRGLNKEVIEHFRLGFAPEPAELVRSLSQETVHLLVESKNINAGDRGLYEIFHNRLMFPIRNIRGKTVGFGGRTLNNHPAKYLNSPESEIFHKKNEIYGLYEALKANRSLVRLLIVEGYMDVVALAQFGITYAVATMGTATNSENISAMLSRCSNITFCFDGDRAGQEAANKALKNCLPILQDGMEISFLFLPEGEDPDTLIRKESRELFEERINKAMPLSEYFFDFHSQGLTNLDSPEAKGKLRERAKSDIDAIKAPAIKKALADMLYKKTMWVDYGNHPRQKKGFTRKGKQQPPFETNEQPVRVINRIESTICLAMYLTPEKAYEWHPILSTNQEIQISSGLKTGTAQRFCELIINNNLKTCNELQFLLATDSDSRNYFYNLFNTEVLSSAEMIAEEAKDAIGNIQNRLRKAELVRQSTQGVLSPKERDELLVRSQPLI
jgi:DNA primase